MKKSEGEEFVIIFEGQQMDAIFLKGLLEQEEIPVFLKDEIMGSMYPSFVVGGVKVIIRKEDLEKAQPIIREFSDNHYEKPQD
ncbi:MAG: DUF2007 domain-containing protein [bacterium]|nr:DUF2007 domain-containing protein [bacterium]